MLERLRVWILARLDRRVSAPRETLALQRPLAESNASVAYQAYVRRADGNGTLVLTPSNPRFRVQRHENGVIYQAYGGDDGVLAVEAWEAYRSSTLPGEFYFYDTEAGGGAVRGTFRRIGA